MHKSLKHLLSIFILLGFMSVASAEEIHLACYPSDSDILMYEIDIDIEQNKLWIDDRLHEITLVTDKHILAKSERVSSKLNRYTGKLTQGLFQPDGSVKDISTFQCKQLEQLF